MRFEIIDNINMRIEHDDKPHIVVNIRNFTHAKFVYDADGEFNDPFNEINSYIADTLKAREQLAIYNAYKVIFAEFALLDVDVDILIGCIQEHLKVIYNLIKVQAVHDYLEKRNMFKIPTNIKDEFTGEYDQERTYNVRKFKGLIALAITARMAIPVWGEFGPLYRGTIGSNRLPIPLMKMLIGTSILESEQFKEFETYSNSTVDAGSHKPELIAGGYGTEFNVNINLAGNFVKRVAVGLNQYTSKLASNIFNFTSNRGAYNVSSGDDLVWAKIDIAGEEEKSKIEKYALRESISQGDIAMIEYYLLKCGRVMRGVDPTIDRKNEYIRKASMLADHLDEIDFIPSEVNIRITQWILAFVLPPKTLLYVGFKYQRRALAAAVMLLRIWGLDRLSLIPISTESISSDGYIISHEVIRKAMPNDVVAKLDEFYPLRSNDKGVSNMAMISINDYYALLNNTTFKLAANPETMEFAVVNRLINKHFCYSVKPETPIELAQLLIKVYETEDAKV